MDYKTFKWPTVRYKIENGNKTQREQIENNKTADLNPDISIITLQANGINGDKTKIVRMDFLKNEPTIQSLRKSLWV